MVVGPSVLLAFLLLFTISLAIFSTVLWIDADANCDLFAIDALAPRSPVFPISINGTGISIATLEFLMLSTADGIAVNSSILRPNAFPRALLLAPAAILAAFSPDSPVFPVSIDGTWRWVALLGLLGLTVAVLATIEGALARAASLSEPSCASLGAVGPIVPLAPDSVDGTGGRAADLSLLEIAIAFSSAVERTITFPGSLLHSAAA